MTAWPSMKKPGALPGLDDGPLEAVTFAVEPTNSPALALQTHGRAYRPEGWGTQAEAPARTLLPEGTAERWAAEDGFVWLPQRWRAMGSYLASELRHIWAVSFHAEGGGWLIQRDRVPLDGWGKGPFKTERAAQEFVESQLRKPAT